MPSCLQQIQWEKPLSLKNCSSVISSCSFTCCWCHSNKTLIDIYFENIWTKQEFRELFWFSNYMTKLYNHGNRWSWRLYADSSFWCRTITLFENSPSPPTPPREMNSDQDVQTFLLITPCFIVSVCYLILWCLKTFPLGTPPRLFSKTPPPPPPTPPTKPKAPTVSWFHLFLKDFISAQVHPYVVAASKSINFPNIHPCTITL